MLIAYTTKTYLNQSGSAASLMVAAGGMGAAFFPIILGAVADAFDFRYSIALLAVLTLLISVLGTIKVRNMRKAID